MTRSERTKNHTRSRAVLVRKRTDLHPTHRSHGRLAYGFFRGGAIDPRYDLNDATIFPSEKEASEKCMRGWHVAPLAV